MDNASVMFVLLALFVLLLLLPKRGLSYGFDRLMCVIGWHAQHNCEIVQYYSEGRRQVRCTVCDHRFIIGADQ